MILALGMLLNFRKAQKHSPATRDYSRFPKVSQHPAWMDDVILHGKPFGIPIFVVNPENARKLHYIRSSMIICEKLGSLVLADSSFVYYTIDSISACHFRYWQLQSIIPYVQKTIYIVRLKLDK